MTPMIPSFNEPTYEHGGPNWGLFEGSQRNMVDVLCRCSVVLKDISLCIHLIYDTYFIRHIHILPIWLSIISAVVGVPLEGDLWTLSVVIEIISQLSRRGIEKGRDIIAEYAEISAKDKGGTEPNIARIESAHMNLLGIVVRALKFNDSWKPNMIMSKFNPYGTSLDPRSMSPLSLFKLSDVNESDYIPEPRLYCSNTNLDDTPYSTMYYIMSAVYQLVLAQNVEQYTEIDLLVLLTMISHMGWIGDNTLIEQLPQLILMKGASSDLHRDEDRLFFEGVPILGLLSKSSIISTYEVPSLAPSIPVSKSWDSNINLNLWLRNVNLGEYGFQIEGKTHMLVRANIPMLPDTRSYLIELSSRIRSSKSSLPSAKRHCTAHSIVSSHSSSVVLRTSPEPIIAEQPETRKPMEKHNVNLEASPNLSAPMFRDGKNLSIDELLKATKLNKYIIPARRPDECGTDWGKRAFLALRTQTESPIACTKNIPYNEEKNLDSIARQWIRTWTLDEPNTPKKRCSTKLCMSLPEQYMMYCTMGVPPNVLKHEPYFWLSWIQAAKVIREFLKDAVVNSDKRGFENKHLLEEFNDFYRAELESGWIEHGLQEELLKLATNTFDSDLVNLYKVLYDLENELEVSNVNRVMMEQSLRSPPHRTETLGQLLRKMEKALTRYPNLFNMEDIMNIVWGTKNSGWFPSSRYGLGKIAFNKVRSDLELSVGSEGKISTRSTAAHHPRLARGVFIPTFQELKSILLARVYTCKIDGSTKPRNELYVFEPQELQLPNHPTEKLRYRNTHNERTRTFQPGNLDREKTRLATLARSENAGRTIVRRPLTNRRSTRDYVSQHQHPNQDIFCRPKGIDWWCRRELLANIFNDLSNPNHTKIINAWIKGTSEIPLNCPRKPLPNESLPRNPSTWTRALITKKCFWCEGNIRDNCCDARAKNLEWMRENKPTPEAIRNAAIQFLKELISPQVTIARNMRSPGFDNPQ